MDAHPSRIRVQCSFSCEAETHWGDQVAVLGSNHALGSWNPQQGVRLSTDSLSYPRWSAPAIWIEQADVEVEYKFVILRADGSTEWEPLSANRRLAIDISQTYIGAHSLNCAALCLPSHSDRMRALSSQESELSLATLV